MKQLKLFLTVALLSVVSSAFAQRITVKGVVTDAGDNSPIIGAVVVVKGGSAMAETDIDGNYEITCDAKSVLTFQFANYKTTDVPVNGQAVINVAMQPDIDMLEEVVVVGYGTAKKISSVVGAATTVKSKVFQNRPVASVGDALQGQVAGLQVFTSSGEPSATVAMRLRGVNSINASSTPLFILDGSPVSASVFTTLNPSDIQNITVLKDASSTAIYGSRAANGVVYITTKKGVSERPVIRLSANYGVSYLAQNPVKLLNSEQYFGLRETIDNSLLNNKQFQDLKNFRLNNNIGINWRDWILNEGAPTFNADLSISGRTNSTDYYISLGALDQEGIQHFSFLKRYSLRSNINARLTNWLKFGLNLGLTYQEARSSGFSDQRTSWWNPMHIADWSFPYAVPYEILYNEDGSFKGYGKEQDYITDFGRYNYFYLMRLQPGKSNYFRLNGNMYQEINPVKGLVIRTVQALEGNDARSSSKVLSSKENIMPTMAREFMSRYYNATSTNTIEYKFTPADKHNIVLLAGQEAIYSRGESFSAQTSNMADDRTNNVNQGTKFEKPGYTFVETAYNSFFGRVSYDFNERYFFDATFRRDGSSLFGVNKRYANFYSFGVMWDMKKENFLKEVDWLNKMQLRASYGTTGNSGIDEYLANGVIGSAGIYDGKPSWGVASAANPDLTWETVKSLNVGLNARFVDRIDFELEFYKKNTVDMLMYIPYSYATGFSGGQGNVGNMSNIGVDVTVGADVIANRNIIFNVQGNFNYNKNEITELFGGRKEFIVPNTGIKYEVGKTFGDLYYVRYAGVDPATGKQLWYDKDGNLTSEYSENHATFTGKQRFAPISAGLNLDFAFRGLSITANFAGVFGKWVLNNSRFFLLDPQFIGESNMSSELLQLWTAPGQVTHIPAASEKVYLDSRFIENASFVRLKSLQLSYTVPSAWISKSKVLTGLRVYAIARNLLTFTNYTGYDPEVDANVQLGNYPNSKQFSFGIELNF